MREKLVCPIETCVRHQQPFRSKNNLQQHVHSLHSGRPYRCGKCGRSFGLRYRCVGHELECGFKFQCSECGKRIPSSQALELHCRRSKHHSTTARDQLIQSERVSFDAVRKKDKRKRIPLLKPNQQLRSSPLYLKALAHSLLSQLELVSQKMPRLAKRKELRDASTQTARDSPPQTVPISPLFLPTDTHFPLFPPSHLLLSDTQTQTYAAESHTESVQTNPVSSHSPSTEHAQVQTQLSYEGWSPDWSLFSHSHSDNLFDFGTQTYETLLGQELGLMDSSVQTYF